MNRAPTFTAEAVAALVAAASATLEAYDNPTRDRSGHKAREAMRAALAPFLATGRPSWLDFTVARWGKAWSLNPGEVDHTYVSQRDYGAAKADYRRTYGVEP